MITALKEAAKEWLRIMLAGVTATIVPIVLSGLNTQTGAISFNTGLITTVTLTLVVTATAKAIDKFLHEWNKEIRPENRGKSMGIIPF